MINGRTTVWGPYKKRGACPKSMGECRVFGFGLRHYWVSAQTQFRRSLARFQVKQEKARGIQRQRKNSPETLELADSPTCVRQKYSATRRVFNSLLVFFWFWILGLNIASMVSVSF